jgi:hypothetical protein
MSSDDPGSPENVDPNNPGGFTEDEDEDAKAGDAATRTLLGFLRLHTFLDLYKRSGEGTLPLRGKVAFMLEIFIHLLTALLLLAIIAALVWKALAPLPSFP